MMGPPERKCPVARTAIQAPGGFEVSGGEHLRKPKYSVHREIATAVCAEPTYREPQYEAGWMASYDDGRQRGFAAFLRPYHEGWYDLFYVDTWLEAVTKALEITCETPDCEYVGDGRVPA